MGMKVLEIGLELGRWGLIKDGCILERDGIVAEKYIQNPKSKSNAGITMI